MFNSVLGNPYYNYSYFDQMESCHYHNKVRYSFRYYCLIVLYYVFFINFTVPILNLDESCKFCSNREFFTECDCFFFTYGFRRLWRRGLKMFFLETFK